MGTVFSFDIRTPATPAIRAALADAVAFLHRADALFSPYRHDSQISGLDRGDLAAEDCAPEVTEILELGARLTAETGGYFSVTATGRLDPSALVKGWAIERASTLLFDAGAVDHCVNGGGDVQTRGRPAPGRPWRIGVTDPADRTRILGTIEGSDLAVATSGTGERGLHIHDPHTREPARTLRSLTLAGRHLTTVDALSTALFAMGDRARPWLSTRPALRVLAVTAQGDAWTT